MYSPISATAALDVSTSSSSSGVCVSSSGGSSNGGVVGSNGGMSVTQAGPASPYSPTSATSSGELRLSQGCLYEEETSERSESGTLFVLNISLILLPAVFVAIVYDMSVLEIAFKPSGHHCAHF